MEVQRHAHAAPPPLVHEGERPVRLLAGRQKVRRGLAKETALGLLRVMKVRVGQRSAHELGEAWLVADRIEVGVLTRQLP
jgi:hypothetical protein